MTLQPILQSVFVVVIVFLWLLVIAFSCFKPLMALALCLASLSYLLVDSQNSLEARSKGSDARRTNDVMISDN
jgi:hypothetical protein